MPIRSVDFVCICYDVAGTNVFKPVIQDLADRGYGYTIVAMGSAAANAVKVTKFPESNVKNITELGSETGVPAKGWERGQKLPKKDVETIVQSIMNMHPEAILVESSSRVQHQIAKALCNNGFPRECLFVYYDNMNMCIHDNPNAALILRFVNSNFQMLLPTFFIEDNLKANSPDISARNFKVVGHPGVEAAVAVEQMETLRSQSTAIYQKLNIREGEFILSFLGGYLNGYEEAFELFVKQVKMLREALPLYNGVQIVVTVHPKLNDESKNDLHEFKMLEKYGIENYTIVQGQKLHKRYGDLFEIPFETLVCTETSPATSRDVMSISSLTLSQSSTLIPEAVLAQIPAHFVNPTTQKNTMVDCGLCQNLNQEDSLVEYFNSNKVQSTLSQEQLFFKAQLLRNAVQRISTLLLQAIKTPDAVAI
ncbi:MAG: hypothetical protein WC222_05110 [Parachlamydiales bacterium]|jgi:hypothetical protein